MGFLVLLTGIFCPEFKGVLASRLPASLQQLIQYLLLVGDQTGLVEGVILRPTAHR
jgi:hypothetical protein